MDKTNSLSGFFIKHHQPLLVRREIWRELKTKNQAGELYNSMFSQYILLLLTTLSCLYITRKEKSFSFIVSGFLFSTGYLHTQLIYEDQLFFFYALEDTGTGKFIREKYIELLPASFFTAQLMKREQKIQSFHELYKPRPRPLVKFQGYAEKHKDPDFSSFLSLEKAAFIL